MTIKLEAFDLHDKKRLRRFVDLPFTLYRHNPYWVPRLRLELLGNRWLGSTGLFCAAYPYHQQAQTRFFLAWRGKQLVGRVAASVDSRYNQFQQSQRGVFAFFECLDDQEAAHALLSSAKRWCQEQGATTWVGPFNFNTNQTCGLLIDAFDSPPVIDMPYNFPYYPRLLESFGLKKIKDLISLRISAHADADRQARLQKIAARTMQRQKVTVRRADPKNLVNEVRRFVQIYNRAWQHNWSFVPLSEAEADLLAENLRPILIPELFLFAEINQQPVAVVGALPDINWALRQGPRWSQQFDLVQLLKLYYYRHRIPNVRVLLFGIEPAYRQHGLDAILLSACFQAALKRQMQEADIGWLLEDNSAMLRVVKNLGATPYKTYRIYG